MTLKQLTMIIFAWNFCARTLYHPYKEHKLLIIVLMTSLFLMIYFWTRTSHYAFLSSYVLSARREKECWGNW